SSRRRHTRFSRDWSSDVCSSDLTEDYNPAVLSGGNPAHNEGILRAKRLVAHLDDAVLKRGGRRAGRIGWATCRFRRHERGVDAQIGRASCRGRWWLYADAGGNRL